MKKTMITMALVGTGVLMYSMYKKKNPNLINNMKKMVIDKANCYADKLENMM